MIQASTLSWQGVLTVVGGSGEVWQGGGGGLE